MKDMLTKPEQGSLHGRMEISEDVLGSWEEILSTLSEISRCQAVAVVKTREDGSSAVIAANRNKKHPLRRGTEPSFVLHALCRDAARKRQPVEVHVSASGKKDSTAYPEAGSMLGLPISWPTGALFGVLCLVRTSGRPFTERIVRLAGYVSRQIATDLHVLFLAERLEKQNKLLDRLREEKQRFIAVAAHDMKNSLNVFLGCCRHLFPSSQEATPKERAYLELAQKSAATLIQLMDELMDIARIEGHSQASDRHTADLVAVIADNIRYYQHMADARGITIQFSEPPKKVKVSMDVPMLGSVITNLLSNALKYSPDGSTVTLFVEETKEGVTVKVKDLGPGIPENEQASLFQPFQRTSVKPLSDETSTGLGLFLARRILEEHGGRIWVESSPGKGSTFCFTLPVFPGDAKDSAETPSQRPSQPGA